jgi:stearoyl-CoA desaturase (delta-9 desaturase)
MPRFGYRSFDTSDFSRNNYLIGVLGFGEGYHNNHHAQPRCAAHGLRWWEFDVTRYVIWLLEKCGLAWEVVWPEPVANGLRPVDTSHSDVATNYGS